MAFLSIPVRSDIEAYEFTIDLENATYLLGFSYNNRSANWSMSISSIDGVEIVASIPLLHTSLLNRRFKYLGLPPGDFLVLDTTGQSRDPDNSNFGTEVLMLYRESTTDE